MEKKYTSPGPVYNTQRTVGGMLAGEFARRYGSEGLPDGTVQIDFEGVAGQSFGAWLTSGLTFTLAGYDERLRRQGALWRPDLRYIRTRRRRTTQRRASLSVT